jgi:hypothetical protein
MATDTYSLFTRRTLGEAKTHLYPRFDTFVLAAQLLTPVDFTIKKGQFGTFTGKGTDPGIEHRSSHARASDSDCLGHCDPALHRIDSHSSIHRGPVAEGRCGAVLFDEREQKLTDDVLQSYYQVLQAQIQCESQRSVVKYLGELLQLTERRFSQHAVLEADRLSVKAEVAKANYHIS